MILLVTSGEEGERGLRSLAGEHKMISDPSGCNGLSAANGAGAFPRRWKKKKRKKHKKKHHQLLIEDLEEATVSGFLTLFFSITYDFFFFSWVLSV